MKLIGRKILSIHNLLFMKHATAYYLYARGSNQLKIARKYDFYRLSSTKLSNNILPAM